MGIRLHDVRKSSAHTSRTRNRLFGFISIPYEPMTILIIALENLERDFRIQKQYTTLSKHFDVAIAAYTPPPNYNGHFIHLSTQKYLGTRIALAIKKIFNRRKREVELTTWKTAAYIKCIETSLIDFDLAVCNDIKSLPIGAYFKHAHSKALVLDAHEYAPGQKSGKKTGSTKSKLICEQYLANVDQALTVSKGIVELYQENFQTQFKFLPNVPYKKGTSLSDCKVEEPYQLICHGSGAQNRGLHELLKVAQLAPNWHLNLMLVPPTKDEALENYLNLREAGEKIPNVSFKEPVPADQVVQVISQYDAGIYLMPGNSLNHIHALPNKFFDFMQAGLAIIVGPELVEMSRIVRDCKCGAVPEEHTPESTALLLNRITSSELEMMKKNSIKAASDWTHEGFEHILVNAIKNATHHPSK